MGSISGELISTVFTAIAFLLALTLHEFAHGFVSASLGDPTPRLAGRLTLNPLKHLDLLGTIAFLVAHVGWAKPVPVDARYYKDPHRGLLLVGLAGPLANFTLAVILAIPLRLGLANVRSVGPLLLGVFLLRCVSVNIWLGIFNLLPVPPLDGSKVLAGLLPARYAYRIYQLESFGPILLLLILLTGVVNIVLEPVFNFFSWIILGAA